MQSIQFSREPARVLLILPTWVGDVVMATPFIDALFQRFPQAEITLLMNRHLFSLLEGSPWVEHCEFWAPRNKRPEARQQQRELLARLKAKRFDLAVMLPNSLRSAWLAFRVGARRRLGFNRDGRGLLLSDRIPVPNRIRGGYEPMPLCDYYAVLAGALGMEHPGDGLQLFLTESDDQAVAQRLRAEGARPEQPLVVLCPGANFGASKCWQPERFAAVADRLVDDYDAAVVISPGPGEEPLAQAICDHMSRPSLLLTEPCLTLGELKSLIADADLLLGNDTGPRHFGRAFDTPRVTVFGPTERKWTETSHGSETIVRVEVPCGPCHKKVCPLEEQVCMTRVTVDMVFEACRAELAAVL
ncbi:lipopolysaccharide heptosyltransferase II [Seongchinamella sediminis]|uniref:lipopolysaccharide heptosyltransferase II n=1 Tax=Seongchinamella sediminis TaxID=2283635 RepID=A0A3L7E4C2_9GAMM|nr:lipopolysaccharide heptosyltransferase II [Seongchinamella sediminis]RLQ23331.1 lipopolysaccharide heptosyltransferase II [Seongchinamella sediminis]